MPSLFHKRVGAKVKSYNIYMKKGAKFCLAPNCMVSVAMLYLMKSSSLYFGRGQRASSTMSSSLSIW